MIENDESGSDGDILYARSSPIFDHLKSLHQELEALLFEFCLSFPSSHNYLSWDIDLHDIFRGFDV
jgi:hypothetical protein